MFVFLQIVSASMKCRYNNDNHNNHGSDCGNNIINSAVQHEAKYLSKYNSACIKNKELFYSRKQSGRSC